MTQTDTGERESGQDFRKELAAMVQVIDTNLLTLKAGWDVAPARQIQFAAHKIAGSSGILGFHQISFIAQGIEAALKGNNPLPAEVEAGKIIDVLSERVEELKRAILADKPLAELSEFEWSTTELATQSLQDTRTGQVIYLVEDDVLQANELADQIGHFGYTVRIFSHPDELKPALEKEQPAAILMDIGFPEGDTAGADTIRLLHTNYPIPVIFTSVRTDSLARLHAIRAGGEAYFTKPINISLLIDLLDRRTIISDPIPYRILIVDDSSVQANFTALHLRKADMEVRIVNEPLNSLDAVAEFNPDLILLDVYMPDCTGMELAAIIRQIEEFVSIPIVFLSAETDRDKQLEAVGLGGDDFLTKPIQPAHLVSSVTSRVKRYRRLRELMLHDSLTGLFNHTTTLEYLSNEILRAARQNLPLAYAMADIDFFKKVNDTYGHATGDRVLKSMAQLLAKRLRQSDIVGRYGGEEFAIILPNTGGEVAYKIMDSLRDDFASLRHLAGDQEFSVTFSCGIASFPEYGTIATLSEAADQLLYVAKNTGRNCVVGAEPKGGFLGKRL